MTLPTLPQTASRPMITVQVTNEYSRQPGVPGSRGHENSTTVALGARSCIWSTAAAVVESIAESTQVSKQVSLITFHAIVTQVHRKRIGLSLRAGLSAGCGYTVTPKATQHSTHITAVTCEIKHWHNFKIISATWACWKIFTSFNQLLK